VKKLLATISTATIMLAAVFVIGTIMPTAVSAQAEEEQSNETTADNENTEAETMTGNYEYVAQPGDSYSQMARKAVQTYGIETDAQIGAAGVLFAETNLTNLAGWPALNEGQTVTISKASVKEWFEKAAKLTAEEKANWAYYVPFVDFNTNHVGEAPRG